MFGLNGDHLQFSRGTFWRHLFFIHSVLNRSTSRKIGGFFKVNCGAMDGDLKRLKKILEAPWLIYVILKGIGKVSNRFNKFSFLMLIGWGRYEWKKRWNIFLSLFKSPSIAPQLTLKNPPIFRDLCCIKHLLWQFESTEYHILAFLMVIIRKGNNNTSIAIIHFEQEIPYWK
jgi:hypothetical protein